MSDMLVELLWWQFVLIVMFYFIFVFLILGLSFFFVIMEFVYVMMGKEIYK